LYFFVGVIAALYGERKTICRYREFGQLAAIGRRTGVANTLGVNFSGSMAWWLWRTIYLFKLPRLDKKLRVALDWTLDLCFAKDFGCVTPPGLQRERPATVAHVELGEPTTSNLL
jgi:NADH:ubiquinone reductase (H+-translocating)